MVTTHPQIPFPVHTNTTGDGAHQDIMLHMSCWSGTVNMNLLLVVVAVVVAPSLSTGLVLSKCELRSKLEEAALRKPAGAPGRAISMWDIAVRESGPALLRLLL